MKRASASAVELVTLALSPRPDKWALSDYG
jgi:hypothetical protein